MSQPKVGLCLWCLGTSDRRQQFARAAELKVDVVHLGVLNSRDFTPHARTELLSIVESAKVDVSALAVGFEGERWATPAEAMSSMAFVSDVGFSERLEQLRHAGEVAAALRVPVVSTHLGGLPEPGTDAAAWSAMVERVRQAGAALASNHVRLALETGQQPADRLAEFLAQVSSADVGVNFDPANFLLYGQDDPIRAVSRLKSYILHAHVKDAVASDSPGERWGTETAIGQGGVDVPRYISKLRAVGYEGPLVIEREAAADTRDELPFAIGMIRQLFE